MNGFNEKNSIRAIYPISLAFLIVAWILIRYPLFSLHGMKDWPFFLLAVSILGTILSFVLKTKITPLLISFSYIAGFFIAYIFQKDGTDPGGGRTNNLWLIWTFVILLTFTVSVTAESIFHRKRIK